MFRELPPIAYFKAYINSHAYVSVNLVQIARHRENLGRELLSIRGASMRAARRDDFRTVARLTLEAARVNRSILEADVNADLAR